MPSVDAICWATGKNSNLNNTNTSSSQPSSSSGDSSSAPSGLGGFSDAGLHVAAVNNASRSSGRSGGSSSGSGHIHHHHHSSPPAPSGPRGSSSPLDRAEAIAHGQLHPTDNKSSSSGSSGSKELEQKIVHELRKGTSPEEIEKKYGVKIITKDVHMEPIKSQGPLDRVEAVAQGQLHPVDTKPQEDVVEQKVNEAQNRITQKRLDIEVTGDKIASQLHDPVMCFGARFTEGLALAGLGFASGLVNVGAGVYHIGKEAIHNPVQAGKDAAVGFVEWVKSVPERLYLGFTDNPFFAGQVCGEIAGGEVLGRATARAGSKVVGYSKKGFKAISDKVPREEILVRTALLKKQIDDIVWSVSEKLYQKGLLKPKLENAKSWHDIHPDVYQTLNKIYMGRSNVKALVLDLRGYTPEQMRVINKVIKEKAKSTTTPELKIIGLTDEGLPIVKEIHRGKRTIVLEKVREDVPEELWIEYESQNPNADLLLNDLLGLEQQKNRIKLDFDLNPLNERLDLKEKLLERWKQREEEYKELERRGLAGEIEQKGGTKQIQILKEIEDVKEKLEEKPKQRTNERLEEVVEYRESYDTVPLTFESYYLSDLVRRARLNARLNALLLLGNSLRYISQTTSYINTRLNTKPLVTLRSLQKEISKLKTSSMTGLFSTYKTNLEQNQAPKQKSQTRSAPRAGYLENLGMDLELRPKEQIRPRNIIGAETKTEKSSRKTKERYRFWLYIHPVATPFQLLGIKLGKKKGGRNGKKGRKFSGRRRKR